MLDIRYCPRCGCTEFIQTDDGKSCKNCRFSLDIFIHNIKAGADIGRQAYADGVDRGLEIADSIFAAVWAKYRDTQLVREARERVAREKTTHAALGKKGER